MQYHRLTPKLVTIFKEGYSSLLFKKDLMAGLILGIIAFPLSVAFAIASGVRPEQGLYTAIIGGFIASFLGGSRFQVSGPTGAFVILIYGIIQQYGYDGLVFATLLAGIFLVLMAVFKFGNIIKFIPYPVTIGFTSGLALAIFTGQLHDFMGFTAASFPADFMGRIVYYAKNIADVNFYALLIGLATSLIVIYWSRVTNKIPGTLIAILLSATVVKFFHVPVETIGDRFGEIAGTLPKFHLPKWNWVTITEMTSPAMSIALLAGIESLLSAMVADGLKGTRHRSDAELFGIGWGNIFSSLFGGIPATGAIARTATNIKSGGETPISGIIHSLVILLMVLFLGKWIAMIPMATLAGVLVIVAYNMSEWRHFTKIFLSPKHDILVLLCTFFLTVFVGLVPAIQAGMVLAAFLFIHTMSKTAQGKFLQRTLLTEEEEHHDPIRENIPEGIDVFEIQGPFFFAATEKFTLALNRSKLMPKVLILRLRQVSFIDASCIRALEDILNRAQSRGIKLYLSGVQPSVLRAFVKSKFIKHLGDKNIFPHTKDALEAAMLLIKPQK